MITVLFIKETTARILDHHATTIIMTFITVIALFGDDVRILSTDKVYIKIN